MLNKVEAGLQGAGLSHCRLDGSSSAKARADMVRTCATADGPAVFLVSLKAGGVGMNLVAASHVGAGCCVVLAGLL
jgi:SNF2 family DNA or RNA helicase